MGDLYRPDDADQVRDLIAWAVAEEEPLEIVGAGTKRGLGRPTQTTRSLDLSGLTGILLYEAEELVLSARAGTTLAEIEAVLADNGQELAFEPPDFGPLFGTPAAAQTIGGVIACNLGGPRRIKAGAARDHFLGLNGVTGRGDAIKAGGRVVKNVTGYDICKLMAGSYGTLAALTEVTVKVLPRGEKTRTVLVYGLDPSAAVTAMAAALGSAHEVSAAAHLPASVAARSAVGYVADPATAVTAVRVEGPAPSVAHRCAALRDLLGAHGAVEELHGTNSRAFWREVGGVAAFAATPDAATDTALWRISVAPTAAPAVASALDGEILFDWGGGLLWAAVAPGDDAAVAAVRAAVADSGGHATLWRAPEAVRAAVDVFQPPETPLAGLTRRVKHSFDPHGVLNPGRMYAGV
jgi:glycolate oxidase FAD binding subunit